jgi:hypothetical protein
MTNLPLPEGERVLPMARLLGMYAVSGPGVHQETKSFYTRRTMETRTAECNKLLKEGWVLLGSRSHHPDLLQ